MFHLFVIFWVIVKFRPKPTKTPGAALYILVRGQFSWHVIHLHQVSYIADWAIDGWLSPHLQTRWKKISGFIPTPKTSQANLWLFGKRFKPFTKQSQRLCHPSKNHLFFSGSAEQSSQCVGAKYNSNQLFVKVWGQTHGVVLQNKISMFPNGKTEENKKKVPNYPHSNHLLQYGRWFWWPFWCHKIHLFFVFLLSAPYRTNQSSSENEIRRPWGVHKSWENSWKKQWYLKFNPSQ